MLFSYALCGALLLTACSGGAGSSSDGTGSDTASGSESASSTQPDEGEVSQVDIENMIVGTWVVSERDGKPELTNNKTVLDFTSHTKARLSAAFASAPGGTSTWSNSLESDVAINGNKMILTDHPGENATSVSEYTITAISPDEFTAHHESVLTVDGKEVGRIEDDSRYVRVDASYDQSILGTWEGHCTSEGSVFDDGMDHRWEYKADGSYVYYLKDGDNWVPSEDETNEYFVAGNLLCVRWVENGEESREWWEITIDGDEMSWTALREGDDGKAFTASFEMRKVA
jgi:hypothetical protein